MRKVSLPHWQEGTWWFISTWSGSLFSSTARPRVSQPIRLPPKVKQALALCDNPYSCAWAAEPDKARREDERARSINRDLRRLGKFLLCLGNRRFLTSTMLASCNTGMFETTRKAFVEVSKVPGLSAFDDTCLQRSLLVAMTSKSFLNSGVLFIGAELSTGEMHAWIIENGEQPDPEDRSWINYRPLLALYK